LGRKFVLQGGTQYNLAAVKAQVDYIKERVPGAEVFVHPHTGEAGAIGAAIETLRRYKRTGKTRFIGIDATLDLSYTATTDESTTCHFCPNECKRTFIDTQRPDGSTTRYISGFSCEKGTVESKEAMLSLVAERKKIAAAYPNLVQYEANQAFVHFYKPEPQPAPGTPVRDVRVTKSLFRVKREEYTRAFQRSSEEAAKRRKSIRIGMPRVLNMYSTAPFFRTYFEALGIGRSNIVFSEETTEEMWVEGGKYGSIDPCFPSKVVQAHIHNLLFHKHEPERNRALNYLFFPILTHVANFVADTMDNASCPIVAGTPDVIKAAFTKEVDFFKQRNMEYLDPALSFVEPTLLARRMFETWGARLGITEDESDHACREGWKALAEFDRDLQEKGRAILETVESENRIAILVLNRPYHSDPGMNHGIPEEFQVLGYPILSIRSIPKTREYLDRYYKDELEKGVIKSPLELNHLWPENYSANSAQKVWGANFAAHHPNVAVLDLSSFKCGHDAPTYGLVDGILQTSRTPAAALHDLDANKPGGSIKIRVKTYAHSLRLQEERLEDLTVKRRELAHNIDKKRLELLELKQAQLTSLSQRDPEIERQIAELGERVKSYSATKVTVAELPAGVVQLGRRREDGSIERLGAHKPHPHAHHHHHHHHGTHHHPTPAQPSQDTEAHAALAASV
ncbi:MAG TPA: acyl-CoA dehydratase activase-related protein, partial [Polyangiaceae bacterium]|nr:acyl-CoA dehydratase activase-related protein [Polyangiaceae bacterium]